MSKNSNNYLPALRFNWLSQVYDPIVALSCREKLFKQKLVEQANFSVGDKVIDIGSGTGTLAMLIKRSKNKLSVTGIDADSKIITIAKKKAQSLNLEIEYLKGMSFDLPFNDNQFDRCVSSLFFHHLTLQNKERTFLEAYRSLKPGGEIHIADWGKPSNPLMRALFYVVQLLDGFETTAENVNGALPSLMEKAGFKGVSITKEIPTPLGTITLYSGKK